MTFAHSLRLVKSGRLLDVEGEILVNVFDDLLTEPMNQNPMVTV